MAETLNTRMTRIETVVGVLAEKLAKLDDVLVIMADAQIKTQEQIQELARNMKLGFQEIDRRFQETDRRFQETDRRFQETDRRTRELDERIDKLVSAIGELIRRERA
jgi:hypothetical protein